MFKSRRWASASLFAIVLLWWNLAGRGAEPLPSLDDLSAQYRALGLPIPPKDAKLVRFEWPGGATTGGKAQPKRFGLAFLVKAATKTDPPVLLTAAEEWQPHWNPHLVEVKPEPGLLEDLTVIASDQLVLAIHCHGRGWDELAQPLLKASQRDASKPRESRPVPPPGVWWPLEEDQPADRGTVRQQLLEIPCTHWELQFIEQPDADRVALSKRLKNLLRQDKRLDTELNRALLSALEYERSPGDRRPGSIEASITELGNYTGGTGNLTEFEPDDCYWRVANLGFEAVPALIEHLDDERLTAGFMHGFNNFRSWRLHIADVAGDLLEGLAGDYIERDWLTRLQGHRVDKAQAIRWWDRVRNIREEMYLMESVLPRRVAAGESARISEHHLHVLAAKYPRRVLDLYRLVLDERPEVDSRMLSQAVLRCAVPSRLKVELFTRAAERKENDHRLHALEALERMKKADPGAPADRPRDPG
jgi:hypothetical protein